MNIASGLLTGSTPDPRVVAFDGDDTLWIDRTGEQQWERHFKHLAVDRLLGADMARVFQARLKRNGFTIEGVRDALLATGRERCADSLPNEWMEQVEALPDLARALTVEATEGLDKALTALSLSGSALWIITKGDLIRQAIKLAKFGESHRFSRIEIVSRKTPAAYRHILDKANLAPRRFTMIGDAFSHDVLPVLLLGARALHVPAGRWSLLRPLEIMIEGQSFRVCRSLAEAAERYLGNQSHKWQAERRKE